jgi:hypothetical protein
MDEGWNDMIRRSLSDFEMTAWVARGKRKAGLASERELGGDERYPVRSVESVRPGATAGGV